VRADHEEAVALPQVAPVLRTVGHVHALRVYRHHLQIAANFSNHYKTEKKRTCGLQRMLIEWRVIIQRFPIEFRRLLYYAGIKSWAEPPFFFQESSVFSRTWGFNIL
jgi:hypothetical protein